MAHHEEQPTAIESVLEVLSEHGLGAMAEAMQTLLNEAMKLERSEFLRAAPGERTDDRTGYANGFKDKALRTRVGELALRVPQVRPLPGGEPLGFYPKSLERGLRSERALKLAIAEMYVQGVSTRRVTEITRELCGLDVTSTDVSRAAAELDAQLTAWRERPLGRCSYLVLDARYEKVRHGGLVIDCAVLVAMGVREEDGKRTLLGVSARTLEEHGPVSRACAVEMASGARRLFGADVAVALTGAAGPEPHGGVQPGQVWVALESDDMRHQRGFRWPGDRELVRRFAEQAALDLVRRYLCGLGIPD